MNDKNWIKFRMIAWSIVAILLSIVLIININGRAGDMFRGSIFSKGFTVSNMKVVKTYNFEDINDLKNIKVNLNVGDLVVSENDDNKITLIVKSNKTLKDEEYIKVDKSLDTLNIEDYEYRSKVNIVGISSGYNLEVQLKLPKSYTENIAVNSKVGYVSFDSQLNLKNLDIDMKTGDIDGNKKIVANKINIYSKVGDMDFNSIEGDDISLEGKIGDIDIETFSGKGNIESELGNIACDVESLKGDLDIKSKIGDIDLFVDKDLSFKFNVNKKFGEINTGLEFNNVSQSSNSFVGEYGDNAVNNITVNIKTGDLEIDN